jgi:hypothetical protein
VDDVRAVLWCPGTDQHRRASSDAAGLVLLRCAELSRSFWTWTGEDWLNLIGPQSGAVTRPWPAALAGAVPSLPSPCCPSPTSQTARQRGRDLAPPERTRQADHPGSDNRGHSLVITMNEQVP